MINETIIATTITAVFAFAGVVVSNHASNRKNSIEQAKRDQKIEDKIQILTDRVDAHNGLSDKIKENGEDISLIKKDIEYIKIDIKDLKNMPICKVK